MDLPGVGEEGLLIDRLTHLGSDFLGQAPLFDPLITFESNLSELGFSLNRVDELNAAFLDFPGDIHVVEVACAQQVLNVQVDALG